MAVVSKRYAEALIKIAIANNSVSEFEQELDLMEKVVGTKEIKDILNYPGINLEKKKELVSHILTNHKDGKNGIMKFFISIIEYFKHNPLSEIDKNIINFYMLLLDHGRHMLFPEIIAEYKEMAAKYKNVLNIEITSAYELEEEHIEKIKQQIGNKYNTNNIIAQLTVDPEVLGGVKVKIGDTVFDKTAKTALDNMGKLIIQNNLG